ncbi:uncharacterized protein LOC110641329 isoform X6 [Hevea brasiliensis]|uniref:uncharacterized protein LOC110641329 isoform X6 n=1 Tax=Hevea brasiliensis TaxID=3981 RepID=UPI0025F734B8|nr:uncharacterized protein LOC110641329 isoform X6 [Hevea brasiliensis]
MGCSVVTQKHFPFIEGRKDLIFFWLSFALTHTKTKRKREREWQWVHGILEHVRRCEIQQFPEVFFTTPVLHLSCRKKERERDHIHPYKVIEITPPPKNLGIRCFPPSFTHRQAGERFRKGKMVGDSRLLERGTCVHPRASLVSTSIELAMWGECDD